jgi:threonine aldolase
LKPCPSIDSYILAPSPFTVKKYFFYIWDEEKNEVRWMTSFATTEEDIAKFAAAIRESCR